MTYLFAATTIICGIGWLKSRIGLHAVLLWIFGKEYTPPTKMEMEACCKVAIRRMFGLKT